MTHYDILLSELEAHGRTSYRDLLATWGARGYTYQGFVRAVKRARDEHLATGPEGHNGPIARADCCPCCGRAYDSH